MALFGFADDKCKVEIYSKEDINDKLSKKSDSTHNHDTTYKKKNDFATVSGTISLSGGNGTKTFTYPSGFNKSNCMVVSIAVAYQLDNFFDYFGSSGAIFGVKLTDTPWINVNSDIGPTGTRNFKILLMKV